MKSMKELPDVMGMLGSAASRRRQIVRQSQQDASRQKRERGLRPRRDALRCRPDAAGTQNPRAMPLPRVHVLPRSRRDLRFASGLVLFTYLTLHMSCHALGLVSLS